jgi:hypothetical protein
MLKKLKIIPIIQIGKVVIKKNIFMPIEILKSFLAFLKSF